MGVQSSSFVPVDGTSCGSNRVPFAGSGSALGSAGVAPTRCTCQLAQLCMVPEHRATEHPCCAAQAPADVEAGIATPEAAQAYVPRLAQAGATDPCPAGAWSGQMENGVLYVQTNAQRRAVELAINYFLLSW